MLRQGSIWDCNYQMIVENHYLNLAILKIMYILPYFEELVHLA